MSLSGNVRTLKPDADVPGYNKGQRYIPVNTNTTRTQQVTLFEDYVWKLCTICGIPIHVHYSLPAYFFFAFFFWCRIVSKVTDDWYYYLLLPVCETLVLCWTVFIHELGQCLMSYLVGGHTNRIILWPLGGLSAPAESERCNQNQDQDQPRTKYSQCFISMAGILTYVPHLLLWGYLLYWSSLQPHECSDPGRCAMYSQNPFINEKTWTQTLFVPIEAWSDYDFFLVMFLMNINLVFVNLFVPAYPLDISYVFNLVLRKKYSAQKIAKLYCVANGVMGILCLVIAFLWFTTGSVIQLIAGFWAIFQAFLMVKFMMAGRESFHPLLSKN